MNTSITMQLSHQEAWLIEQLRHMKPYERMEITKDKEGRPNRYLLHRSTKYMVSELRIEEIN
jgi:hypothetical protein